MQSECCHNCYQPLEEWEVALCERCGMIGEKPKRGRPAPLGRKVVASVRLTPDVDEFCRQHPEGFPVLESTLRASKEFKAWTAQKHK